MKIDTMTGLALGVVAFTAWYVFKKPAASTASTAKNPAIASAIDQRKQVGAGVQQNADALYSLFGMDSTPNLPYMGGGQGLVL